MGSRKYPNYVKIFIKPIKATKKDKLRLRIAAWISDVQTSRVVVQTPRELKPITQQSWCLREIPRWTYP